MNLKEVLNDKQEEAATYLDGHLRIIAGAGSGKTRVITYRIAYLIEAMGVDPRNILAITFTNKAANEMKERVENLLGGSIFGATISTIHSLCVRVLRQHASVLGYTSRFIIMDEEDQKSLLKKLLKEYKVDKSITVKSMINYISSCKIHFVSPEKASSLANFAGEQVKADIYGQYVDYNKTHNMMDFDDLLINTLKLFQENPDIVSKWSRRYQYVHVDEFQDVGEIEYDLIHFFGQDSIVCVVGDPDQTIYSFRGSDVNFIMNFDSDYENVKTVILDRNYRSTQNILNISNNLIRKNINRMEKDLYTDGDEGKSIIHYSGINEDAEATYIVNTIEELEDSMNLKDIAILYRANYLSRPIEQSLIKRNIPYKIYGGLKFFNRKEVKDALSYLRLLVFNDDLSFERVVNVPARGVGNKTLDKIIYASTTHQLTHYETLCFYSDDINLTGKAKKALKEMVTAIEKARVSQKSLEDVFHDLLIDVGYMDMLKKNEEDSRIENILELKNSISIYMKEHPENPDFEHYLQDIALYTSQDENKDGDFVSLMSIHMSKGLEFDTVFVAGLSENIFPSIRSIEEEGDEGLEEERRLAYVAMTRAKKRLYLTESQGYSFVSKSPKIPSRFIDEIGKDHVEHIGTPSKYKTKDYINPIKPILETNNITDWRKGDMVVHDYFGKGVIINVNGNTLDIAFSVPHGLKTIMANHKSLRKLFS